MAIRLAAAAAALAVSCVVWQALRLFRGEARLPTDAPMQPIAIDLEMEPWASLTDAPMADEKLAAEFQADMYGIVKPLVAKVPDSTRARCMLASTHRRFARNAEAATELKQCLLIDPECAEAHYLLGILAAGAGDPAVAELHFQQCFNVDPRWADVAVQLAEAQVSQDKIDKAVRTLDTYVKREPGDGEAWCELGQLYQRLGDPNNAKRCHEAAIKLTPDLLEALYGLATTLRELGELERSQECLDKFQQLRTAKTESVRLERAQVTDDDFKRKAIADMAVRAGAVYAMYGFMPDAEAAWTRATTAEPTRTDCLEMLCRLRSDLPERWMRLGHALIQNGHANDAEGPFRKAIELAPDNGDAYAALAQVYMLLDRDKIEAHELAERAVRLTPTAPNYFTLAATCERRADWDGAISALAAAVELDPADPAYQEALDKLQEGRKQ